MTSTRKDTRIVCDTSHNGLAAGLEHFRPEKWQAINFAFLFLIATEGKYSTNELEKLVVVGSSEFFSNELFGQKFTVVTDHKALITLVTAKWNHKDKNFA